MTLAPGGAGTQGLRHTRNFSPSLPSSSLPAPLSPSLSGPPPGAVAPHNPPPTAAPGTRGRPLPRLPAPIAGSSATAGGAQRGRGEGQARGGGTAAPVPPQRPPRGPEAPPSPVFKRSRPPASPRSPLRRLGSPHSPARHVLLGAPAGQAGAGFGAEPELFLGCGLNQEFFSKGPGTSPVFLPRSKFRAQFLHEGRAPSLQKHALLPAVSRSYPQNCCVSRITLSLFCSIF